MSSPGTGRRRFESCPLHQTSTRTRENQMADRNGKKEKKEKKPEVTYDGGVPRHLQGRISSTPEADKKIVERAERGPARNGRRGK